MFLKFFLILLVPVTISAVTHNYYLGKYENIKKMNILMRKSLRTDSKTVEDLLAETLTYPSNLGAYGGVVQAIHVAVRQSSLIGRLYITYGGIGNSFIEMVAEAEQSTFIEANYTVYGELPFVRKFRVKYPKKQPYTHGEL